MPPSTLPSQVIDLLTQMIDDAVTTVDADGGRILLLERESGTFTRQIERDFDSTALEAPPDVKATLHAWRRRIIEREEVLTIHDLPAARRITSPAQGQPVPPVYRSLLGIPICARGKVLGLLELAGRRPGKFTGRETTSLKLVGREMGLIFELAKQGWESRITADRFRLLNDTTQSLSSCTLAEDIFGTLSQGVRSIYADGLCLVIIVDRSRGILRTVLRASPEGSEQTDGPAFDITPAYDPILTRQELMVARDLATAARCPHEKVLSGEGCRTSISIPIAAGDHVLGILAIGNPQPVVHETGDIDLLLTMAHHAAVALMNARVHATLQQKAKKYRALIEDAPEAILLIDVTSGAIVESNSESRSLTGYDRHELIGQPIVSLVPSDSQSALRDALRSTERGTEVTTVEIGFVLKDGTLIDAEIRLRAVSLEGGGLAEAAVRDVSRQRRAARDMRRRLEDLTVLNTISETLARSGSLDHMLRSVLDNALQLAGFDAGGIFLLDEATSQERLMCWAGVASALAEGPDFRDWGHAIGRYLGETAGALIVEELAKDQRFAHSPIAKQGYRSFLALPLRISQRNLGSLWMASRSLREVKGRTVSLLSHVVRHLALAIDEFHAIENLRRSEADSRLLFESGIQAVAIVNADGSIVRVNSRFEQLTGQRAGEIVGRVNLRGILGCQLLPKTPVPEGAGNARAAPMHYDISVPDNDGEERWLDVAISGLPEGDQYLVSILDVTDRKRAQIALARENEELRQQVQDLERFNRFSIGRERRIHELKARIDELEGRLPQQERQRRKESR